MVSKRARQPHHHHHEQHHDRRRQQRATETHHISQASRKHSFVTSNRIIHGNFAAAVAQKRDTSARAHAKLFSMRRKCSMLLILFGRLLSTEHE